MEYLKRVIAQAFIEDVERKGEVSDNQAIWSKVRYVHIPVMWEFKLSIWIKNPD